MGNKSIGTPDILPIHGISLSEDMNALRENINRMIDHFRGLYLKSDTGLIIMPDTKSENGHIYILLDAGQLRETV